MPSTRPASRTLVKVPKHPGIYRRGENGQFEIRFRDAHGRQRSATARSLKEAQRLKSALTTDVHRGEFHEQSKLTLAQYVPQWLETYNGRTGGGIREATRADYKTMLETYAVPRFGKMRLTAIRPTDLKGFLKALADDELKPNTVRNIFAPVRALLATAAEDGLIRHSPATGIRLATANGSTDDSGEPQVKALTEEQLQALISAIPEAWQLLVKFLAHTGLRIGELVALVWADIDLGEKTVKVSKRIYRGERNTPKSRHGIRTIPLTDALARELFLTGRAEKKDEPVFPSERGTALDQSNIFGRIFKPAAEKAGVPWAGFHTLRHTCATQLFRNGANAKQVQHWLGHHSPSFTLDTYVHLLPEDQFDPEKLGGMFTPKSNESEDAKTAASPDGNPTASAPTGSKLAAVS